MSTRLARLLLAAVAVVSGYVVLVVGDLVPRFLQVTFQLRPQDVVEFMSHPTRFATASTWLFVVAGLVALSVAFLLLQLHPAQAIRVTIATVGVQALIVWIAFFCFCYDGFCGPMSLHHGPEFDPPRFFRFGAGVFPVTLVCILIPLIGCFVRRSSSSVRAEPLRGVNR